MTYNPLSRGFNKKKDTKFECFKSLDDMITQHCGSCLKFGGGRCRILSVVKESEEQASKTFKFSSMKKPKIYYCTGWERLIPAFKA